MCTLSYLECEFCVATCLMPTHIHIWNDLGWSSPVLEAGEHHIAKSSNNPQTTV